MSVGWEGAVAEEPGPHPRDACRQPAAGGAARAMLIEQEAGKPVDAAKLKNAIEARVTHVLKKQVEAGMDEVNDGEQGRVGFQTYVPQRMSGFGGVSERPYGQDWMTFPQFYERFFQRLPQGSARCTAPPRRSPTSSTRAQDHIAPRSSGTKG